MADGLDNRCKPCKASYEKTRRATLEYKIKRSAYQKEWRGEQRTKKRDYYGRPISTD